VDWYKHSRLEGQHAFLSPSKYSWVNYPDEKLDIMFHNAVLARRGVELHDLACRLIRLGIKLPVNSQTLNRYVNDAIGYQMTPEQILYVTDNCFGTADAICFEKNVLRIHDLKTGVTPTSFVQLRVYAAMFCLEYHFKPSAIQIELRLYQNDNVLVEVADSHEILRIMDRIKISDRRIEEMKMEMLS
jgi:hypothetical protein